MKWLGSLILVLSLLVPGPAFATMTDSVSWIAGDVKSFPVIQIDWVAKGGGGVDEYTTIAKANGYVYRVVTIPGTVHVPTNGYDIYLLDSHGVDIMGGTAITRSSTAPESVLPRIFDNGIDRVYGGQIVKGPLTVRILGNNVPFATGTIFIYIERPAR